MTEEVHEVGEKTTDSPPGNQSETAAAPVEEERPSAEDKLAAEHSLLAENKPLAEG
jgi:hypothetical protein